MMSGTRTIRTHRSRTAIGFAGSSKLITLLILFAGGFLTLYLATGSVKSKSELTSSNKAPLSFDSGYALDATFSRSIQEGSTRPLAMVTGDFDNDGVPDLLTSYESAGGTLALRRGNAQARFPNTREALQGVQEGRFAQPFLSNARGFVAPEAPDFLVTSDTNHDGRLDVISAARGSRDFYVFEGNGAGGFAPAQKISVAGPITALLSADVDEPDGFSDLIFGVSTSEGPSLLVYYGTESGFVSQPRSYSLSAEATDLTTARFGDDGQVSIVAAAGNEVAITHGPSIKRVSLPFSVRAIVTGEFIWDRAGRIEIAALSDDGTIQFLAQGQLDRRPFTSKEIASMRAKKIEIVRSGESHDVYASFLKTLVKEGDGHQWMLADSLETKAAQAVGGESRPVFIATRVSNLSESDLILADARTQQLRIVKTLDNNRTVEAVEGRETAISLEQKAPERSDSWVESVDAAGAPVAILPMRLNLDTKTDLLVLREGNPEPLARIFIVNPAITVDRTDDNAGATACTAAANDCSLRGAIIHSNNAANDDVIMFAATTNSPSTLRLTLGPFDDEFNLTGDVETSGDLDVKDNTNNATFDGHLTITGNGIDTTIIEGGATTATGIDRVFDVNNFISFGTAVNMTFIGVTIRNGKAPHVLVDPGPPQQFYNTDGGGVKFDGFDSNPSTAANGPTGILTISGCKITANEAAGQGGGVMAVAGTVTINDNGGVHTEISSNVTNFATGGGLNYAGGNTAVGQNLSITNAVVTGNSATSTLSGNGGGIATQGGSAITITGTTISNNTALTNTSGQTEGGGGIHINNSPVIAFSGGSITGNSARNNGGGIWVSARTIANAVSTISINNVQITGNTADSDNNNVGNGGGIYNLFGNMTVGTSSNISGNAAINGGGIFTTWNQAPADAPAGLSITGGTVGQSGSGNTAKNNGGGIAIDPGGTPTLTSNVTLSGVTLKGNTADSDTNGSGSGGAIFGDGRAQVTTSLTSTPTIGGTTAGEENTAAVGGGLFVNSGSVSVTGGTLNGNKARTNGGGIAVAGGTATLDGITIQSNIADSDNNGSGDGGGIYRTGGTLNLNNTITIGGAVTGNGNSAVNGGGIASTAGNVSMTNGSIRFNKAKNNGGGVLFTGAGTLTLSGVQILNNQANSDASGGGDGGGIHNSGTTVNITNNSALGSAGNGNSAANGGAIANTGGTFTYTGTGAAGGTIVGNSATSNGGGVFVNGGTVNLSVLQITGNSATGNGGAAQVTSGALNISLSRIVGNTAAAGSGVAQSGGTALVEANWWGCDGFPNTGSCQTSSGTIDADPRIDLLFSPASGTVATGGSRVFTADVSKNSNGATINPVVMNGLTVNFSLTSTPTGGSIAPPSATISSFTATTTYTAGGSCGIATLAAQIDGAPGQSASVTVTCNADLAVTKTDSPDPVVVGSNITYTIDFTNGGPTNDTNVTVTDAVPANTTFVSASITTGAGWSISSQPAVGGTGNVVFSKADVAAAETASFQMVVNVNSNVANNTTITNNAVAAGDPVDPVPGNNTGTATTTAITNADLAMTKSDSPDPVTAGNNITYTIGFMNNGPNAALTATISDPLPAGTTLVSVTTPGGWMRTDSVPVGGTGTIAFSKASVANAESATITLVVKVAANVAAGTMISNTATAASATTDPTPGNNSATATTTVDTNADLALTKGDAPDPVQAGSDITYTINFVNNGPSDAQTVTVTDATPVNTTFVSASVSVGAGWSVSAPAVGGTGNVIFSKATVAASETAVFSIVVNVDVSTMNGATITNTANAASVTADATPGNNSATATTSVVGPPELSVKDAQKPEPPAGSASMLFTVTLSSASGSTIMVHYATADDTLGANPATSNVDYTPTSGDLTFNAGDLVKTIEVPILADGVSPEADETFLLNLSAPSGATINDGQAVGTITQTNPAGVVLISELRTSGPNGSTMPNTISSKVRGRVTSTLVLGGDSFVELYNNSDSPFTVTASDASAGWGVYKSGVTCGETPILIATIPNGTMIPARGHYLLVGSGYSLGALAAGDQTLSIDLEHDRNVGVFSTANVLNLSSLNAVDAVGFGTNTGSNCELLREGTNLPATGGSLLQYSWVRDNCGKGGNSAIGGLCSTTTPIDNNNNATDFYFVDTQGTFVAGVGQRLGAPGPENLTSPIVRNSVIATGLVDPGAAPSADPNRLRDVTPNPGNNSTFGTLSIRRSFTNNTGAPVTRLRFRIVDITSFPSPGGGIADVRAITSSDIVVNLTGGGTAQVRGTTLESPPAQPNGGAWNSSMGAGIITPGTPLAPGASVNLQFLLGVQTTGTFRFFINIEALP